MSKRKSGGQTTSWSIPCLTNLRWRSAPNEPRELIEFFYSRLLMNHTISADVHQSYMTPGSMFDQLREASEAVSTYIVRHLPKGAEGQLTRGCGSN